MLSIPSVSKMAILDFALLLESMLYACTIASLIAVRLPARPISCILVMSVKNFFSKVKGEAMNAMSAKVTIPIRSFSRFSIKSPTTSFTTSNLERYVASKGCRIESEESTISTMSRPSFLEFVYVLVITGEAKAITAETMPTHFKTLSKEEEALPSIISVFT